VELAKIRMVDKETKGLILTADSNKALIAVQKYMHHVKSSKN